MATILFFCATGALINLSNASVCRSYDYGIPGAIPVKHKPTLRNIQHTIYIHICCKYKNHTQLDYCMEVPSYGNSRMYSCNNDGSGIIWKEYSDSSCSTLINSRDFGVADSTNINIDCYSPICVPSQLIKELTNLCSYDDEWGGKLTCNETVGCIEGNTNDNLYPIRYYVRNQCVSNPL